MGDGKARVTTYWRPMAAIRALDGYAGTNLGSFWLDRTCQELSTDWHSTGKYNCADHGPMDLRETFLIFLETSL